MPEIYSRNLAAADYDDDTQVLTITFQSTGVYEYEGVPKELYEQLISSIDPGGFFTAYIKSSFSYERVG